MSAKDTTDDGQVHTAAMALPASFMTEQWMGSHVYKVGTSERFKMFAILTPGKGRLTVKTSPETATILIHAGVAEKNAHLPRGGWVVLKLDQLAPDDVSDRIEASYALVLSTLPLSFRKKLELD